jgi:hypothetical protein
VQKGLGNTYGKKYKKCQKVQKAKKMVHLLDDSCESKAGAP